MEGPIHMCLNNMLHEVCVRGCIPKSESRISKLYKAEVQGGCVHFLILWVCCLLYARMDFFAMGTFGSVGPETLSINFVAVFAVKALHTNVKYRTELCVFIS